MHGKSYNNVCKCTKNLTYYSNGTKAGAKITNSYQVRNPVVMYDYLNINRGDEVSGTTTGVVFEWVAHNMVYDFGEILDTMHIDKGKDLMDMGRDLDFGNTIYDDDHGIYSTIMQKVYEKVLPPFAEIDSCIKISE